MGLDFIYRAKKSFHKGLDRARIALATPDLFTQQPDREPRAYAAKLRSNTETTPGEDLSVRLQDGNVVAQRGMNIIADFDAPPAELLEALEASYGEACGTVREVHEIAEIVEIAVC